MKLWNIASLDETLPASRRGLNATSLLDRTMWEEMQADWERFAIETEDALSEAMVVDAPASSAEEEEHSTRRGEDRAAETTVRIGQAFFRTSVINAYNSKCCITGLSLPSLLVASHIIPWSVDERNRLNPRNGLLLSALHDKAFDLGFLTVDDEFKVRVSYEGISNEDSFFASAIGAYDGHTVTQPERFGPDRVFLRYHREHIFRG